MTDVSFKAVRETSWRDLLIRFGLRRRCLEPRCAGAARLRRPRRRAVPRLPCHLARHPHAHREGGVAEKGQDADVGAIFGATALVAFAAVAWWLLARLGALVALAPAAMAWLAVAVLLYLALRGWAAIRDF